MWTETVWTCCENVLRHLKIDGDKSAWYDEEKRKKSYDKRNVHKTVLDVTQSFDLYSHVPVCSTKRRNTDEFERSPSHERDDVLWYCNFFANNRE